MDAKFAQKIQWARKDATGPPAIPNRCDPYK